MGCFLQQSLQRRKENGMGSASISINASVAENAPWPANLKTMYRTNLFISVRGLSNTRSETTARSGLIHRTEELTGFTKQSRMKKFSSHFLFQKCAIIAPNRPV